MKPGQVREVPRFHVFTIWTRPRETMRAILESDPRRYVLVLAALIGVKRFLERATRLSLGDGLPLWAILLMAVVLGAVGGIISVYILGSLWRWTGKWLGGQASARDVRAAVAWASIPSTAGLALWVPEFLLLGKEAFTSETPRLDASPLLSLVVLIVALMGLALGLWSFVLLTKTLGEAHRFSAWRGLASVLLGLAVFLVPALCFVVGAALLGLGIRS